MRKITITEGLVELKLLDSRIRKATVKDWAIGVYSKDVTQENKKKFEEVTKANYQSIKDLINERAKIKSAIVKSNAKTQVKVGEKKMTVAEAIERKSSIDYEKDLLSEWKTSLAQATNTVEKGNEI